MQNSSLSQYRQSQMSATAPEKTVLMLYDGAIRFLNSAIKELTENNNIVEKANLVEKTVKIIEYLQSCLDMEKGGEIAENLSRLYDYMSITLTKANLKNDPEKMKEVVDLLSTIRDGWNGICNQNSGVASSQQPAAYAASGGKADNDNSSEPLKERKLEIKV